MKAHVFALFMQTLTHQPPSFIETTTAIQYTASQNSGAIGLLICSGLP